MEVAMFSSTFNFSYWFLRSNEKSWFHDNLGVKPQRQQKCMSSD